MAGIESGNRECVRDWSAWLTCVGIACAWLEVRARVWEGVCARREGGTVWANVCEVKMRVSYV